MIGASGSGGGISARCSALTQPSSCSPRATINLALAAKATAFLHGRVYVTPDDVREIALDVLRHRVIVTYEAEAEELTSDAIVKQIIDTIQVR